MATARIGLGTVFQYEGTPGAADWVTVAQITALPMPEMKWEDEDVTNLDSTGRAMEFLRGMLDGGTFEIELLYTPAARTALQALVASTDANNNGARTYRILVSSLLAPVGIFQFTGYMNMLGGEIPVKNAVKCKAGFKINGAVSYA